MGELGLNALLYEFDNAVVNWLDASCDPTRIDGSNIAPYFASRMRWNYQYDPSTNTIMDYGRIRTLPAISVRRTGANFNQERFTNKNAKMPLKVVQNNIDPSDYTIYWIPAPVPVDITYEISLISNYMQEHNSMVESILGAFDTGEIYLNINEFMHHMKFENHADESTGYDLEEERVFASTISTRVLGYLVDTSNKSSSTKSFYNVNIEVSNAAGTLSVDDAYNAWLDTL